MKDGELASWRWTLDRAREAGDRRAVRALEEMGPPPYSGDWQARTLTQRRLLARFGGEVHGSRTGAMAPVLGGLLFSREYRLGDRLNYFRGIFGSMKLLWPELLTVDLIRSAPRFEIPVLFMLGRHDQECPAESPAGTSMSSRRPPRSWSGSSGRRTCPTPRSGTPSIAHWWTRSCRLPAPGPGPGEPPPVLRDLEPCAVPAAPPRRSSPAPSGRWQSGS